MVGGTIQAARDRVRPATNAEFERFGTSIVCHIGGGLHHAFPNHGEGFCPFNDVAVAVRVLQRAAASTRIAIVDLDVHHGNGTLHLRVAIRRRVHVLDAPAAQLPDVEAARLARHRPADGAGDDAYLAQLERALPTVMAQRSAVCLLSRRRRSVRGRSARRTAADARTACARAIGMVIEAVRQPACRSSIVLAGGYARRRGGHGRRSTCATIEEASRAAC